MQLTAAAVTPPAEHAARRPAGAPDASAADAGVRQPLLQRSGGKGDLMLELFLPEKRNRTFLLLAAFVVFAIAAGVIGISDNAVGISLVVLSAASLVLAVAHSWSTSVQYRRLAVASALGFVVLLALGIVLSASVDLSAMPGWVGRIVGAVGTGFLLGAGFLCIPGFAVGVIGIVVMRRRERGQRSAA
jgi:hypothetical protein